MNNVGEKVNIPTDLQGLTTRESLNNFTPNGQQNYLSPLCEILGKIEGFRYGIKQFDDRNYPTDQVLAHSFRQDWGSIRDTRNKEIRSLKERITSLEEVCRLRREALVTKIAERTLEKAILVIAGHTTPGYLGTSFCASPSRMEASLAEIQKSLDVMVENNDKGQKTKTDDQENLTKLYARTSAYLEQLRVIAEGLKKEEAAAKKTTWAAMFYHHYQEYLVNDGQINAALQLKFQEGDKLKKMWDAYVEADKAIRKLLTSFQKEYNISEDKTVVKKISTQFSDLDNLLSTIESLKQDVLFHEELGSNKNDLKAKLEDLKKRVAEHQGKAKERTAHIDNSVQAYTCWDKALEDILASVTRKMARLEKETRSMDAWAVTPAKLTPPKTE